ncbi:MAG TPA: rhomboid family intramembrane serine protease [Myxococcota bacterium]|nr:rhomboid family intramembrane serine protease [Myxococcota bacterium]
MEIVRLAPDRRTAEEWVLVLVAEGIEAGLTAVDGGIAVTAGAADVANGRRLLDAWERENRLARAEAEIPPTQEWGPTSFGVILAGALVLFFLYTGAHDPDLFWFARGSARSASILRGEYWRTITALTLHADLLHVAANAAACALFVTALARALGPGLASALLVGAGACANALTALVRGPGHDSLGASTAVFAAVGALASLSVGRRRRGRRNRRWQDFAPFAAGLGLLAMLGTAPEADYLAHLFGLGCGALLGGGVAWFLRQPPRPLAQAAWAAGAAAAVAAAWLRALD